MSQGEVNIIYETLIRVYRFRVVTMRLNQQHTIRCGVVTSFCKLELSP